MCNFNVVIVPLSVKKEFVTIRKLCVVYCFMRVTDETVQSLMLYLVRKYIINIYIYIYIYIYICCVLLLFVP